MANNHDEIKRGAETVTRSFLVPSDWSRRWPASTLAGCDVTVTESTGGHTEPGLLGDLLDLTVTKDGNEIDTTDLESAELNAAIEAFAPSRAEVEAEVASLDFDRHYEVAGYPGVAFYLRGYVERDDKDTEWSGIRVVDRDWVRAVMVGDDQEHEIEVSELKLLGEDAFCHVCGQIGCEHDGKER